MPRTLPSASPISDLFGIRYPIIAGGMVWVSGWKLAAAVSEAGGLGLLGAGSMKPALLEEHIQKTTRATDHPFGVNIPIFSVYADQQVQACIDHKVPIVFTAAGTPSRYTEKLKRADITVCHVVSTPYQAQKAETAGCDAVVAEGVEAGGHVSFEQITSMVLWPLVVDAVRVPVIAAGGISDGRSMAAAISLGAAGVQLGSRFAVSRESSAHPDFKQRCISADAGEATLVFSRHVPTRALRNPYVEKAIVLEQAGASPSALDDLRGKGRSKRGIFEGQLDEGELEIGQVTGRIQTLAGAGDIVRQMVEEYEDIRFNMTSTNMNAVETKRGTS